MSLIKDVAGTIIAPISKDDIAYQRFVSSLVDLQRNTSSAVIAVGLAYNAMNLFEGLFACPTRKDIEDLEKLAEAIMYEINELVPLNIELVKIEVRNALDRLLPDIDTTKTTMVSYDRLFGNYSVPPAEVVDNINSNLYLSDDLFKGVTTLFKVPVEMVKYSPESFTVYAR